MASELHAQFAPVVELRPGITAAPPVSLRQSQSRTAARAFAVAGAAFLALIAAAEGMLASALFAVRCGDQCTGEGVRYTFDSWQWSAQFALAAGVMLSSVVLVVLVADERHEAAHRARVAAVTLGAAWLLWFFVAL